MRVYLLTLFKLLFRLSISCLTASILASVASNLLSNDSSFVVRLSVSLLGFMFIVTVAVRDCRDFCIDSNASFVFFCVVLSRSSFYENKIEDLMVLHVQMYLYCIASFNAQRHTIHVGRARRYKSFFILSTMTLLNVHKTIN